MYLLVKFSQHGDKALSMFIATFVERVKYAHYLARLRVQNCSKQNSPELFSFRLNFIAVLVPCCQRILYKPWLASEQLMEDRAKSSGQAVLVLVVLEKEVADRVCAFLLEVLVNQLPSKNRFSATRVS